MVLSEGSDVVGVGDVVEDVVGDVVVGVVSAGVVRISAWRPRRGPRMTVMCWPGVRGRGMNSTGVSVAPSMKRRRWICWSGMVAGRGGVAVARSMRNRWSPGVVWSRVRRCGSVQWMKMVDGMTTWSMCRRRPSRQMRSCGCEAT